jgi:hypothetical protein
MARATAYQEKIDYINKCTFLVKIKVFVHFITCNYWSVKHNFHLDLLHNCRYSINTNTEFFVILITCFVASLAVFYASRNSAVNVCLFRVGLATLKFDIDLTTPHNSILKNEFYNGLIWRTSSKCRKRAIGEFSMGRVCQCPYKTSFLSYFF